MTSEFEKKYFEQNLQAERELERINVAERKLIDKYQGYEELESFVIYLASMERLFAQFRIYESSPATIKEELIKTETYLFSQAAALDKEMLESIKSEFDSIHLTVSGIYDIAEKFLKRFQGNEDCCNFIKSLRDTSLILAEAHERAFSIDEVQKKICKSQIDILCADGEPEPELLEQIYSEFKAEIEKLRK